MADYSAEIAELEAILQSGVLRVVIDGQTVERDFDEIRRQLKRLRQLDDTASSSARSTFNTLNLSGSSS